MKMRAMLVGVLLLACGAPAFGDVDSPATILTVPTEDGGHKEIAVEPAIVNQPTTGFELFKAVTEYLEPQAEQVFLFNGKPFTGFSGSVLSYKSNSIHVVSLRAGYGLTDRVVYVGPGFDVPGIVRRYVIPAIPQRIKDGITVGLLGPAWELLGQYGQVSALGAYDFDQSKWRAGASVGASIAIKF